MLLYAQRGKKKMIRKINKKIMGVFSVFLFVFALTGCGQQGPLYMPKPETTNEQ